MLSECVNESKTLASFERNCAAALVGEGSMKIGFY